MNYKMILHISGWVLVILAAAMLLPLICALILGESTVSVFLTCIAISLAVGLPLLIRPPKNRDMYDKEGMVIVALSWILISVFGALPFLLSHSIPHFVNALFETVSGFTTTGASILADVESLPKSILFWRSFTHWLGGMGVLVFLVAILPLSGGNNLYLIQAESPGPSVSKLVPKVKKTATILYAMYIAITLLEILLLLVGKMPLFDAITLSFGTAGTGGFGILNDSIASYSSYQQIVITVFMILFGIDFSVYYLILMRRFRLAFRSDEVKAYLGLIFAAALIISVNCLSVFGNYLTSLKHSFFQVASVITTTGYSSFDFDQWPELSKTILVLLMFVGACAGSTGGGIKVSRIVILLKSIIKQVKITVHPHRTYQLTMNGRDVAHETLRAINVYMAAYLAIFAASLLIISLDNHDFTTNFTAVLSTMNNIGPGLAKVGPSQNFSIYSPLSLLVLTMDMLIGRLEIFPILCLFSVTTWKK